MRELPFDVKDEIQALTGRAMGKVRVGFPVWLRPFLQRSVIGITLGRTVYLSPLVVDRSRDSLMRVVRHELVHVRQVNELGLWRFLYRYVREYLKLRRSGLTSAEAYNQISFEREAYAAESSPAE